MHKNVLSGHYFQNPESGHIFDNVELSYMEFDNMETKLW